MIVKVITYAGTVAAPISNRIADENLHMLKQPCLSRQRLTVGGQPVSSEPAPKDAFLAEIQVENGKTVCLEVNPEGRDVQASSESPWYTGNSIVHFGPGWTVSVIEAS